MPHSNVAFVFPGQGSQYVGMCADFYAQFPIFQATFAEANDTLGFDLWDIIHSGPEDRLALTEFTQPAIFTCSIGLWRLWLADTKQQPSLIAGHSLGEYSALVAAGAMTFASAVALVHERGRLMQQAMVNTQGAMSAIVGLESEQVIDICAQLSNENTPQHVAVANFNSSSQVVIAGHALLVEVAEQHCKKAGAKLVRRLNVSVPSHCELMRPVSAVLSEKIEKIVIQKPAVAIVQNVDAKPHVDPEMIQQNILTQLYQPVLWMQTIEEMRQLGIMQFVECGPSKVLQGLIKRVFKGSVLHSFDCVEAYIATKDSFLIGE